MIRDLKLECDVRMGFSATLWQRNYKSQTFIIKLPLTMTEWWHIQKKSYPRNLFVVFSTNIIVQKYYLVAAHCIYIYFCIQPLLTQ